MNSNFYGSVGYRYTIHHPTSSMRGGDMRILLINTVWAQSEEGKLM